MLTSNKISLSINNNVVFSDISMTFLPSSITYITGPNGSGKTSLLRMLAGIQKPSSGHISFGKKAISQELIPKPYCLYVGHHNAVKTELTVLENLIFWSKFYNSTAAIGAALHFFKLADQANRKCYELSAGNKQKVALSRLLACNSNLWLLDEVDQSLDQENRDLLDKMIISKADVGGMVIMTTHEQPRIKSATTLNMMDYE